MTIHFKPDSCLTTSHWEPIKSAFIKQSSDMAARPNLFLHLTRVQKYKSCAQFSWKRWGPSLWPAIQLRRSHNRCNTRDNISSTGIPSKMWLNWKRNMLIKCQNSWFLIFKYTYCICASWTRTQTHKKKIWKQRLWLICLAPLILACVYVRLCLCERVCLCVCEWVDVCSTFYPSGLESFPVYPWV